MIAERERKRNVPKVLVEIRMAHYEEKRKDKFRIIKEVSSFSISNQLFADPLINLIGTKFDN